MPMLGARGGGAVRGFGFFGFVPVLPVNTVAPSVSGTVGVNSTLTASPGTWTGDPTPTFSYQWQRGTSNISGATGSTYTAQLADIGSTLRCVVTATNIAGAVSANSANSSSVPEPIGVAMLGGYYAGRISTSANGVATHYLIVAPKSSGQNNSIQFKTSQTFTAGTDSFIDGPGNTAAMNNANHPAAQYCAGRSIGGFSDWYMPARNEIEVCYYNLKPTTESNDTSFGANTNAVPSRGSNYSGGTPGQTSASDFQSPSGTERFDSASDSSIAYWASTQNATTANFAHGELFNNGIQANGLNKVFNNRVRAVRRVAV
jgi:hypothetical protein